MQGPRPNASVQAARKLLGVTAEADRAQLARAYRRQARRFHPDVSRESDATERFWALQAAYRLALTALARATGETSAVDRGGAGRHNVAATTAAPTPTKQVHVQTCAPIVVIDTSTVTSSAPWKAGSEAWVVAGPVQVRPAPGYSPRTASTSRPSPGEPA
jgi:hypothetical protein